MDDAGIWKSPKRQLQTAFPHLFILMYSFSCCYSVTRRHHQLLDLMASHKPGSRSRAFSHPFIYPIIIKGLWREQMWAQRAGPGMYGFSQKLIRSYRKGDGSLREETEWSGGMLCLPCGLEDKKGWEEALYALTKYSPLPSLYNLGFSKHVLLAASPTFLSHAHLWNILLCCSAAPGRLRVLAFRLEGRMELISSLIPQWDHKAACMSKTCYMSLTWTLSLAFKVAVWKTW